MRDQYKVLTEQYDKIIEARDPNEPPRDYTVKEYEIIIKKLLTATDFEYFKEIIDEYFVTWKTDFPAGTSLHWNRAITNLGFGSGNKGNPNYSDIAHNLFTAAMETEIRLREEYGGDDTEEEEAFAEKCFNDLRQSIKTKEELYKDNPGVNIDI